MMHRLKLVVFLIRRWVMLIRGNEMDWCLAELTKLLPHTNTSTGLYTHLLTEFDTHDHLIDAIKLSYYHLSINKPRYNYTNLPTNILYVFWLSSNNRDVSSTDSINELLKSLSYFNNIMSPEQRIQFITDNQPLFKTITGIIKINNKLES